MALVNPDGPKELPIFRPSGWERPHAGRFFDSEEGGAISTAKGNRPAANLIESVIPGVITGKIDEIAALGRSNSLWTLTFGLACCAIEMISAHMAHHDLDRFGVVTWPSPRQSDVMIVAGTVVKKMADPIKLLYEQMPDPKWVIAMGTCATSGGPYYRSYSVVMGVDHLVPVDVYVPGCPPRPEALMDGIIKLQQKIKQDAKDGHRSGPITVETPNAREGREGADGRTDS
jgi:NADH-quinone oxidoreductase subunit B